MNSVRTGRTLFTKNVGLGQFCVIQYQKTFTLLCFTAPLPEEERIMATGNSLGKVKGNSVEK